MARPPVPVPDQAALSRDLKRGLARGACHNGIGTVRSSELLEESVACGVGPGSDGSDPVEDVSGGADKVTGVVQEHLVRYAEKVTVEIPAAQLVRFHLGPHRPALVTTQDLLERHIEVEHVSRSSMGVGEFVQHVAVVT